MSNESANYVAFAVVVTVVICLFLFLRKEKEPSEIGRYAWGRNGSAVLDTADGTVYLLEGGSKEMSILEVHPWGVAWRKRIKVEEW